MADEKVKDFIVINFCECFKSTREALYSELGKEQNLRKGAESFYNFLKTPDEVEKYVELVEKTPEAKIRIQSSSSDGRKFVYNIEILILFDPNYN